MVQFPAWASTAPGLYGGSTGEPATLEQALQGVHAGHVVIVSEEHDVPRHHENQLLVLEALQRMGLRVSVGLEFLAYPDQPWVDRFVRGEISEPEFLQATRWEGYPFEWYRPLLLFPRDARGLGVALNTPPEVAQALGQRGIEGLTDDERSLLPPGFQVGNSDYFERFVTAVGEHSGLSSATLSKFFAAQSAWDDTMAWRAVEFLAVHPEQVLVIIVGDFHAIYGGGLPDRLRARGASRVLVISQVSADGLREEEIQAQLRPDPRHGARADFVWLTDGER